MVARCPLSPVSSNDFFKRLCPRGLSLFFSVPISRRKQGTVRRDIFIPIPVPNDKDFNCLPSIFTGTAQFTLPPLTIFRANNRSLTGLPFCHTPPIWRLNNSLMRPPVLTPSMKSHRLREAKVPSNQLATCRIYSLSKRCSQHRSSGTLFSIPPPKITRLCESRNLCPNSEISLKGLQFLPLCATIIVW